MGRDRVNQGQRRIQFLGLVRAEAKTLAVAQHEGDDTKPGHMAKPAEATLVKAPACEKVRAHNFGSHEVGERGSPAII